MATWVKIQKPQGVCEKSSYLTLVTQLSSHLFPLLKDLMLSGLLRKKLNIYIYKNI